MKRFRRIVVFVMASIGVLVAGGVAWFLANRLVVPEPSASDASQTFNDPEVPTRVVRSASDQLLRLRRAKSHPAVSACVARNGVIRWAEAQGLADLSEQRPVTLTTPFPIGSVAKPITATATMMLVEQRRLDLDTDIREYVPEFPPKEHPVTARQLLCHQAGIRHYRLRLDPPFFEMCLNVAYGSIRESLSLFADDPLAFRPDASFQYSTYGYSLVGAAVETAAGRPFLQFMHETLFEPLSMTHTRPDDPADAPRSRATDYIRLFGGNVIRSPATNSSNKWAGGGFLSTPQDLVRFGAALLDDRILAAPTREIMFTPRTTLDGETNAQNYGLGWRIGKMQFPPESEERVRVVHHGGTSIGAQAVLLLVPGSRIVVAVCANSHTGGSGDLLQTAGSLAQTFMSDAD